MAGSSVAGRGGLRVATGERARRAAVSKPRRGGRPSHAQALKLRDSILEVATALFLAEGYGATSIDAIAERAGISKRTFYHRFEDKAALFTAVVHRIIEQIRPPPEVPLIEGSDLREILRRLAGIILRAALAPQAIALQRLIIAESVRFPHLTRAVYGEGWKEATSLIGGLLAADLGRQRLGGRREFAAIQFMSMLVTLPQRRIFGLGPPMTQRELQAWADDVVDLFLHGCQGLSSKQASRR